VIHRLIVLTLAGTLVTIQAFAQQASAPPPTRAPGAATELIALDIQVVVSRVQDTKKISSLPYSLAVNASEHQPPSQLRMGADVPVPTLAAPKDNPTGLSGAMPGPVSYRDIGTQIDCRAKPLDGGRFELMINLQDTSVYTNVQDRSTPTVGDMPVFRTFRVSNHLILRDGQTRQFTAATDRVSGEVVQIEVTLRVVK